ncbi:MAG: sugar phosphate isomerase/epimerase [Gammaproteobacteria bacterium]|nr:sugar phosphate isomerase/epimerase [Gammaproteobacteria bacterium]
MSTNTPPISVQLYSLREESKADFDGVLSKLAMIGYAGVEPFNLFGKSPRGFRNQVESLGMKVSSSHFPWVNRSDDINQVGDVIKELGLSRAPGGFAPDDFKDMDAVKRTIDLTQDMVKQLKPLGLTLFLHNHYWEFADIDGRTAYHYLQDAVPEVEFEIDTYWAANFGHNDPAAEIRRVRSRTPLIHVKDGPLEKGLSHVAVGFGKMDIPALFKAVDPEVLEWAVVELDQCDTEMIVAIAQSYKYLTQNNLAKGNV